MNYVAIVAGQLLPHIEMPNLFQGHVLTQLRGEDPGEILSSRVPMAHWMYWDARGRTWLVLVSYCCSYEIESSALTLVFHHEVQN